MFSPSSLSQVIQSLIQRTQVINKSAAIMSTFVQRLNPITGQSDWVVQNEEYDYHQEVARASFADMLHDTERNVMYERALKVAIDHMHHVGKKAHVLDIGTGTGLLSMMAVRHGADSVVACEAFEPMGRCAVEIIKLNGYEDAVRVIPKRSTELKIGPDLPCRANILVTEVFDTELIGEGALGTFRHAHDFLLEKDCIVVPHSATIYAQIIESPLITNWNRIKDVYDDEGELLLRVPDAVKTCKGTISLHDVQLSQLPLELVNKLTLPRPVFRFDWSGRTPFIHKRTTIDTVKAETDGTAQAVFMWWELNMDVDNEIVLSCAPFWAHPSKMPGDVVPWRDHWMQAIYYFPKETIVKKGDELCLISCHDEYSLWFNLRLDLKVSTDDYKSPSCNCGVHLACSRTRLGMLNDGTRTKKYVSVISDIVSSDSNVLILGHGFYTGLAASKRAQRVFCMEPNALSRRVIRDFVAANGLTNVEIIEDVKTFTTDVKIDLVLAEPFFTTSILPWDNLLFLYALKEFEQFFSTDVRIVPKSGVIRGVAVEFDDLHKIRSPLVTCQGFEMEPFDKLISNSSDISDETVEAQPLWEYPSIALSEIEDIANIELGVPKEEIVCEKNGAFNTNGLGNCNGIVLWVDWILDPDNQTKYTVTTGPVKPISVGEKIIWDMHTRQGVCLLGSRAVGKVINYMFSFNRENGSIHFKIK